MRSSESDVLQNCREHAEYRRAFVEETIRTRIAHQIYAMRKSRGISRPAFAKMMGKSPSWVFRLEDPNQPPPTIPTLIDVAEALGMSLSVSFCPLSKALKGGPDA